jgi:large subunit ribosomal protein L28
LVPINCSFDFSGVQVNCSSISHSSIGWSRQQQGKISGFVIHTFVLITGCATQWSFLYGDEGSCDTCQARVVTFSHKRIEKVQRVNSASNLILLEEESDFVFPPRCIKTVNKMGSIDATAKKFGVDLTK